MTLEQLRKGLEVKKLIGKKEKEIEVTQNHLKCATLFDDMRPIWDKCLRVQVHELEELYKEFAEI